MIIGTPAFWRFYEEMGRLGRRHSESRLSNAKGRISCLNESCYSAIRSKMGSANHNSGESGEWQMMNFQRMPLLKRAAPFDDPDWIYELKMDGFRVLAIVELGRAQLLSLVKHSVSRSCSDLHICLLP